MQLILCSATFSDSKCQLTTTLIWSNLNDVVTRRHIMLVVVSFIIECAQSLIISFERSAHVCCPHSNSSAHQIH